MDFCSTPKMAKPMRFHLGLWNFTPINQWKVSYKAPVTWGTHQSNFPPAKQPILRPRPPELMKELWQASQGAGIRTWDPFSTAWSSGPTLPSACCYVGFFVSKATVWRDPGKTKVYLQLSNKNIANSYVFQGGLFFVFGDFFCFILADGIWLMDGMKCGWGVKSRVFCLFGVDKAQER